MPYLDNNMSISAFQSHFPEFGSRVFVHDAATIIGQVSLGDDASVWPGVVIRGDVNFIRIGHGTNIQDLSMLHVSHQSSWDPPGAPLIVGNHVTVGHSVILHGCTLEDECLIGMGSTVMDKVVVQKHVLLGAGSLVPEGKILESGYLYIGRPAKKVRALTEAEIAHFSYSAQHYMRLKDRYLHPDATA